MYTYEAIDKMNTLTKEVNRIRHVFAGIFFGGILLIFITVAGCLVAANGSLDSPLTGYLVVLFFVTIGVYGAFFLPKLVENQKEIQRIYKETFLNGVFEEFFDDVEYKWNKGFDIEMIEQADVFTHGGGFYSEDYLSATYKGVSFQHADVQQEKKSGDDMVYFCYRLLCFDFPFKQVSSVKIIPKFDQALETKQKVYIDGVGLEPVKLENVEFNKIFFVGAKNPEEAFYILTPQMMEYILTLWKKYGGYVETQKSFQNDTYQGISFHFKQDKLYVGISGKDSFDPGAFKQMDYPTEKARIRKDIQVIIDVIEMLNIIKESTDEENITERR